MSRLTNFPQIPDLKELKEINELNEYLIQRFNDRSDFINKIRPHIIEIDFNNFNLIKSQILEFMSDVEDDLRQSSQSLKTMQTHEKEILECLNTCMHELTRANIKGVPEEKLAFDNLNENFSEVMKENLNIKKKDLEKDTLIVELTERKNFFERQLKNRDEIIRQLEGQMEFQKIDFKSSTGSLQQLFNKTSSPKINFLQSVSQQSNNNLNNLNTENNPILESNNNLSEYNNTNNVMLMNKESNKDVFTLVNQSILANLNNNSNNSNIINNNGNNINGNNSGLMLNKPSSVSSTLKNIMNEREKQKSKINNTIETHLRAKSPSPEKNSESVNKIRSLSPNSINTNVNPNPANANSISLDKRDLVNLIPELVKKINSDVNIYDHLYKIFGREFIHKLITTDIKEEYIDKIYKCVQNFDENRIKPEKSNRGHSKNNSRNIASPVESDIPGGPLKSSYTSFKNLSYLYDSNIKTKGKSQFTLSSYIIYCFIYLFIT